MGSTNTLVAVKSHSTSPFLATKKMLMKGIRTSMGSTNTLVAVKSHSTSPFLATKKMLMKGIRTKKASSLFFYYVVR